MATKGKKKKTAKRKKSTKKKSTARTKTPVSTDNIKSFMKMNNDMETAVYGFAGELKLNQNKEISPTQLLSQSLKYLKCYAENNNINITSLADRTSAVEGKDYSVSSKEEIAAMNKQIRASRKLDREVASKMRTSKTTRSKVRSAAGKKSAAKKTLKGKMTPTP